MLTTLEANFVQEYKINGGNATQAVIKAGYQAKYPSPLGSQLLKKPHIRKLIETLDARTTQELTQPIVRNPYLPAKVFELPTKEQYAGTAWNRQSDSSNLKPDLKHKYFETTGKVLGHLKNESENSSPSHSINLLCNELNIFPALNSPEEINLINSQNVVDIKPIDDDKDKVLPVVTVSTVGTVDTVTTKDSSDVIQCNTPSSDSSVT